MDLRSIYIANGVGIFILLMLYYTSHARVLKHHTQDRLFTFLQAGVMLGCFFEAFSYALDGHVFPGAIALNHLANTYLFSFNMLLPFGVLVYVDYGLYGDWNRIWKHYKLQIAVGIVMLCANVVNLFFPISYALSDQNVYTRMPFGYVYYAVILFYLLTALFVTKRYERENGAKAFISITLFLIPILVGAALQFMFYGLSLAWLASALGLVGLYIMQQNELAFTDPLVDTYNRQYLDHVLSAWTSKNKGFIGVMLDIDHFKSINDNYGHTEGDNALKALTDILKHSRIDNEWVFRFAGDEFIVLKMTDSADGLVDYMDEVGKNVEKYNRGDHPYQLELSWGMSQFGTGGIDAFMKEMDDRMYEMKAEHHARANS